MDIKGFNIALIGCGGTGSWIVHHITKEVAKSSFGGMKNKMILMDGDSLEHKNTIRQAFTVHEIGLNKAFALAQRYSKNFEDIPGFEMSIIRKFILDDKTRTEHLERFIDFNLAESLMEKDKLTVFISVVDNNKSRKAIHEMIIDANGHEFPHFIIDAGNEDVYGQVTLSSYFPEFSKRFKNYWEIHPEMKEFNDGVKAGPSCADHDEVAANAGVEQTMSANMTSALLSSSLVRLMLESKFDELQNEIAFVCNGSYSIVEIPPME